jgi:cyclic pyranopterin monophosphate synthase
MVNITHKSNTLRQAIATAIVRVSSQATIDAVEQKKVAKGDVFEFSRAAGLLAIKKTSDLIPDCHPLPVEYAAISYAIKGLDIIITVEVHTIYKTGVEVEAMHGASLVALTIYDMLKPIDKGIEISTIRLQEKKGGKTDLSYRLPGTVKTAIVICSDSVSKGISEDLTGNTIKEKLASHHIIEPLLFVVPDEFSVIQQKVKDLFAEGFRLAIFAGGTGLSARDITPEAIAPMLDRQVPGIMETARQYGQQRMPYAMLSRGIAGFVGQMLVLTLPGSPRGAAETIDALFPQILHVFKVAEGERHG